MALLPVLAVILTFVLPYGAAFWKAFTGADGGNSLWGYAPMFRITFFTIKQAFFSVLAALALGLPGAWLLGSGKTRFTSLLRSLTAIPFAMPSILVVLGFVLFFGNSGWLNRLIGNFNGTGTGPLRILYRPAAIVLAHGFYNFPIVIRFVGDGLAGIRRAYVPAARNLGASPFKTLITVIFPMLIPSILGAVLLVFLYCFTSFAVVLVLGGGPSTSTLAVEIYRFARISLNYHNAGILAILETFFAVLIFAAYVLTGKKNRKITADIEGEAPVRKDTFVSPGKKNPDVFKTVYCVIITLLVIGPLFSVILESFLFRSTRAAGQTLSLRWWYSLSNIMQSPARENLFLSALMRSIFLSIFSASLTCVFAVLMAGTVKITTERKNKKKYSALFGNSIVFFACAPIVSSGIVLGLGWLILYGRKFSHAPFALVIIHAVMALPIAFNFVSEGFRSLPENLFDSAAVFGAGPFRRIFTVAVPLSLSQLRSAWGFAAAMSLGELNMVMMLGMEDWETLPLFIYRAAGAYRYGTACAAGTVLILGCTVFFLLSELSEKIIKQRL